MDNILHNRTRNNKPITLGDLKRARYICALLIKRNHPNSYKLLPLFERLEKEVKQMEEKNTLMDKILEVANDNSFQICDTK